MKLSRKGSGCGGRSHPRRRRHLRRILPPTMPPTPPPIASAEMATITINPADVAIAVELAELLLLGERKCYGRGGGVTGGGDGRRKEASTGPLLSSGGVTGGADRRRDDRCRGQRGKHRSHGRGREQASPEGRAPAIPEEDRHDYCRRRAPVLPEGATVGAAWEGERWCDRRGERSSYGRGERRRYRRDGRRRCRRGRVLICDPFPVFKFEF